MAKGLFVTGTGTDIGKTYVTGLIVKKMRQSGYPAGYYKAAVSGADSVQSSDAGYVNRFADIGETDEELLSYLYKTAVSPHLAARLEGNPVKKDKVIADYQRTKKHYAYMTVEGSGGIICPIRHDQEARCFLEDVIRWLHVPAVVVSPSGLGSINDAVLTVFYMEKRGIPVGGIFMNHYHGGVMEEDNVRMIEEITGKKVLALIRDGDRELNMDIRVLAELYQ
jgi:dethiobiotin synthetase